MSLPTSPVTLSVEQVDELNKKLTALRHDVNNHLSLVVAAAELIKFNPDSTGRMCATLAEQPPKIADVINKFSIEIETLLRITRS